MILECTNAACRASKSPCAEYQSEIYGAGMRVHNPCQPKNEDRKTAGCTLCGNYRIYTEKEARQ